MTSSRLLLTVAGLGGLLYGVDVGIIGGALPYLEATSGLGSGQLSIIVAAVLLGSVISTLFAGGLADWFGRKPLMVSSGFAFLVSIPVIALAHGFVPLFLGRLLQGVSGGFIGVVVPLYLAETLPAERRGSGTAIFQWMLTLGIVTAALIGIYFSYRVEAVARLHDAAALFRFQDQAWRSIFWVSLPPGLLFLAGSLLVSESPRWKARALASGAESTEQAHESLFQRRYVLPFLLACIILFCNTATGINSIIGYNTTILLESGLSDVAAHWGYVLFTAINFAATTIGYLLVDRKGRRFLLILGTAGVIISISVTGLMFRTMEHQALDVTSQIQAQVSGDRLDYRFDADQAAKLGQGKIPAHRASLTVIYSYGGFSGQTNVARSSDAAPAVIAIRRDASLPGGAVEAFFRNPTANIDQARQAPLSIERALLSPIPSVANGWLVAGTLYLFMIAYAIGPGVCVWLALSELMPQRIRSHGMSIALVINQMVSTTLAAVFLPVVGNYGYSTMFFLFAGFTLVYFVTVVLALPETKGKSLEEIERAFA